MQFKLFIQHYLPQHAFSKMMGILANCRIKWWKNWAIRYFIKRYQVNLNEAVLSRAEDYADFNSFFTRFLKKELRPIVHAPNIASPVDGTISQIGFIDNDMLIQAKASYFKLRALLGGDEAMANVFYDGSFMTLYLAPKDYHRVHMPLSGTLKTATYIPGKLFSVNPQTVESHPQLFAENERLIAFFETEIGPIAVILVGAIIVSGIEAVWPLKKSAREIVKTAYDDGIYIEQGAELGHFKVGSTVIILFPKDIIEWSSHLNNESVVKMGQSIGTIVTPADQ
jgi:phosphatidylserine decarboxylase